MTHIKVLRKLWAMWQMQYHTGIFLYAPPHNPRSSNRIKICHALFEGKCHYKDVKFHLKESSTSTILFQASRFGNNSTDPTATKIDCAMQGRRHREGEQGVRPPPNTHTHTFGPTISWFQSKSDNFITSRCGRQLGSQIRSVFGPGVDSLFSESGWSSCLAGCPRTFLAMETLLVLCMVDWLSVPLSAEHLTG